MSRIDRYKHTILGSVMCESDYDFMYCSETRIIAILLLYEK